MYMGKSKISVAHALFIIDTYDSATSIAYIHGPPRWIRGAYNNII